MRYLLLHTANLFVTMNAFQSPFKHASFRNAERLYQVSSSLLPGFKPYTQTVSSSLSSRTSSMNFFTSLFSSETNEENFATKTGNVTDDQRFDYTTTRYISQSHEESFYNEAERDADRIQYPKGTPKGFYIIKQYTVPSQGFQNLVTNTDGSEGFGITQEEVDRLDIDGGNITLPLALILLDGEEYPSLSRARKSCRKGYIVIHRGPLKFNETTKAQEFDIEKCTRGRVGDRVFPGDVIGKQVRMHGGFYPGFQSAKPAFDLPVVYEDDHFAIVNKPAGVVVYSQRKQNHGLMTVRAALPFVLKPPKRGTLAIIRRPASVHRLDKPTSGLLLVAKTKPAMVHLTRQFVERKVKKTYTAILNGIPSEPAVTSITGKEAEELNVDVDPEDNDKWQLIDHTLDEKSAVTVWKPLEYVKSLKAADGTVTLVELKPKTGRYHQLRRHMAWVKDCPIIGDTTYDGGGEAMSLRGRGLFLCSNKVTLEHPYYNSPEGRAEWDVLPDDEKWANGTLSLSEDRSIVEVHASIDLPNKFQSFLSKEGERQEKLCNENVK